MTSEAEDRFTRSRLIEGWDSERLGTATAVVAGVGALGNEVAKNLALAGVGRLVLCDPDVVAVSNLSRTVLFGDADVGRPKAIAAAEALRRLAPAAVFVTREHELVSGIGLGELADADIVLGCLDSVRARMQLLGRCALAGAALVDGGTGPWTGEVRLRLDPDEPCFGCTLSYHERGLSSHPWSCAAPPLNSQAPASIVSTSLVAAWMTLAALRILFGEPPPFRMLRIDGPSGRTEPIGAVRDPNCPHHRLLPPAEPIDVTHRQTIAELLTALPDDAEPIAWARLRLPSRCPRCGPYPVASEITEGTPDVLDSCPACGALVRPRFSERLRDVDPARRLFEIGVAPEEILTIRLPGGGHEWRRLKSPASTARMKAHSMHRLS